MIVTDGTVWIDEFHVGDEFYHCILVLPTGVSVELPGYNVLQDCLITDRNFFWENPGRVAAM